MEAVAQIGLLEQPGRQVKRTSRTGKQIDVGAAPARYADVAKAAGCAPEQFVDWLEQLNVRLKLPRLGQCRGVVRDKFDANLEKMASDALASGSPANNPRVPTAAEIVEIYRQAW